MKTPILETERLILRPLQNTLQEAQHIFSAWTSDKEVAKYMRWSVHKSVSDTAEWLLLEEKNIDSDNYNWGFVLKETGELIGAGGLVFVQEHSCYELGYNLMRKQWGKGLATEAARRILLFAQEELHQKSMFCCHAAQNTASENIILKLGFKRVGTATYEKFDKSEKYECITYKLDNINSNTP